jgi:O-methyltransferase
MAELGVYKGHTARLIHHYIPERPLHLFDTFDGFDSADISTEGSKTDRRPARSDFSDTSVEGVLRYIEPRNDRVHIHKGRFPDSAPASDHSRLYAFVHLDADLYAPIKAGLDYFYPRITRGGFILIHDFNAWPGTRQAVEEFFRDRAEDPIPMPDKSGSALIKIL